MKTTPAKSSAPSPTPGFQLGQPAKAVALLPLRLRASALLPGMLILAGLTLVSKAAAQTPPAGDVGQGRIFFQQNCAICHASTLGPHNEVITGQGPNLVGILDRRAGTGANFNYTKALSESGLTWDGATLERFLASPPATVPGTIMPVPVPNASDRLNVIAYLSTLAAPAWGILIKCLQFLHRPRLPCALPST